LVLALMVLPVTLSQLVQPGDPFHAPNGFQPWMAVALAALLAQLVGQMAISRLAMGWNGSLGEALLLALRRVPGVLGALLLFFLCLSLLLVPTIVVLMLAGGNAAAANPANGVALLAMFAAAPRILLAPGIAMSAPLGPWALVKRNWTATRGHYWRLLGFFLLFLLASLILALAAGAVFGTIAMLVLGRPDPLTVSRLVIALAGGIVQGITGTVYAVMLGRIVAQLAPASNRGM
jgi:hypothetical protein